VGKKNDVSYSYKNSINIDREHGFTRRYDITPANIRDSQMLPALVDLKNEHNFFFGDSVFAGKLHEEFLSAAGWADPFPWFESYLNQTDHAQNPLCRSRLGAATGRQQRRGTDSGTGPPWPAAADQAGARRLPMLAVRQERAEPGVASPATTPPVKHLRD
jgi:hypothetical protein